MRHVKRQILKGAQGACKLTGRQVTSLHREESGQVTFLFVFASIAVVILLGLLLNTAQHTSRKMQMQGAVDSAAVGGAVWMARGMNMMVYVNKGMADILSVMIVIHAVTETSAAMPPVIRAMIAALTPATFTPAAAVVGPLIAKLAAEGVFYAQFRLVIGGVDDSLSNPGSGIGWTFMRGLDSVNQGIKRALPMIAEAKALAYGRQNGATAALFLSGRQDSLPILPVGRGGNEFLAIQANACTLPKLAGPTFVAFQIACAVGALGPCISGALAYPIYNLAVDANVAALSGGHGVFRGSISPDDQRNVNDPSGRSIQERLDEYNRQLNTGDGTYVPIKVNWRKISYHLGGPLAWPDNPPLPMLLTDNAQADGGARIADVQRKVNLAAVRKHLQYLALATGRKEDRGTVAARYFLNPSLLPWVTYGEGDVYNPIDWSMFTQTWRAKMARATLLDDKWNQVRSRVGIPQGVKQYFDLSFVNSH